MKIGEARTAKKQGLISREEFWDIVSLNLQLLSTIGGDIQGAAQNIQINNSGLVVTYQPDSLQTAVHFNLNPLDKRSAPFVIVADGTYEPFQASLIFKLGRLSRKILDIGSNVGFYTTCLAISDPTAEIHAFEPNPEVFHELERNLALNGLSGKNTVTHNIGLSDLSIDNSLFFVPKYTGTGGGSLMDLHPDEGESIRKSVNVRTLDELNIGEKIDLIKIDVEGAEYAALRGACKTISLSQPTIVAELLRKWMKPFGAHPQDVVNLLSKMGYRTYAIGENQLTQIQQINDDTCETNFIFVHGQNRLHYDLISQFV